MCFFDRHSNGFRWILTLFKIKVGRTLHYGQVYNDIKSNFNHIFLIIKKATVIVLKYLELNVQITHHKNNNELIIDHFHALILLG